MTQHEARFGGIDRLFGKDGAQRLRDAHVCIVGIGGVGSWAVEALARSCVGQITLVDLDDVCISNVNRQLHALTGTFGKPKVDVMAERVRLINPDCRIHARQEFFLQSNADAILSSGFDYVFDAIDRVSLKALLIAECCRRRIPVISAGGAGGRRDPTAIEVADLAFSCNDRLLKAVRKELRAKHGFTQSDKNFNVECVFSREQVVYAQNDGTVSCERGDTTDFRIDCSTGFGTASFVTGTFGLVAASRIVQNLAGASKRVEEPAVAQ
ncbi:MAG TPA: tRNA threonylcarbamoyladenosine dehydratase [Candidatus Paceibacterota bacterium]|nr:tRNA threonylcarbamoyladenosine dehydratase [Candidatus Paceibacterota bacterium]